jgi:sucrose-6-phosphate hydrolase SacC (GH32 family)
MPNRIFALRESSVVTAFFGVLVLGLAPETLVDGAGAGEQADATGNVAVEARAVAVHDTSVNPFIMPQRGTELGDPFPTYWDGVWHLYTLSADLRQVLHFTSNDLAKWTEHRPAMVGRGIATCTVVRYGGKYYLFYTDAGPQTIRLVVSDNPWHFDFAKSRLVAQADNKVYQLHKRKFRDCYVFYNEEEVLWWMLVEATNDNVVAVGLFKSKDLLTWTQHDPIFKDESRQHASCPQLFKNDGHWYLTCLDYPTWYYYANEPHGPWKLGGYYHTSRLTAASRWADDGKRRLGWGFFTKHSTPEGTNRGYGGPLGVGREMIVTADGAICVRPLPELIAALREPNRNADIFACAKELSGKWTLDADRKELQCTSDAGGVLLLDLPEENPNYYFEAEIELFPPEATAAVVVRCSKEFDEGYRVALKPAEKRSSVRQFAANGGTFDEREHAFASGAPTLLQIVVCDGQIEAFVDGRVSLSSRVRNRTEHRVAIAITGGRATIHKPLLHYFQQAAD